MPNIYEIGKYQKLKEFIFQYAQENIARLNVYIKDPFYTKIKRDEQMTVISFIGNIGGLLGLCLGLSMISIFEIVYFAFGFVIAKFQ